MNLLGYFLVAQLAENSNLNLWQFETKEGKSIKKCLDWMIPYINKEKDWSYEQIKNIGYGDTIYLDPIINANKYASYLKEDENCDLVICLSHLGYKYKDQKVSDQVLAKQSRNIDLIIGAHTHTFMSQPDNFKNADGKEVKIFQVGFAGINLGRVDYYFEKNRSKKTSVASAILISDELDELV